MGMSRSRTLHTRICLFVC